MVRLFVSDRILIDSRICNGGIVVSNDGKIEEVFKNERETSEWLDHNHHVEVSTQKTLKNLQKSMKIQWKRASKFNFWCF